MTRKLFVIIAICAILLTAGIGTALAADYFVERCGSNETFVRSLYLSVLLRQPETEGFNYWINTLRGGTSREEVIRRFFDSKEYRDFARNNRTYAFDLYRCILGRMPDVDGHAYWTRLLDGGKSRESVMSGFFSSPEYQGIVGRCR